MKTKKAPALCFAAWACAFALLALRVRGAEADRPDDTEHGPGGLPFPLSSVVGDDYHLQPLDLVVFELFNEPDATTQQRVSGSGELRLPMLGSVSIRGLTVGAAEKQLESLYRIGGFYRNPQVTLYVSQHTERTISVLGQVNRPDRLQLLVGSDSMGLAQAVALAGGLTRIAKASAIQISRVGPDGRDQRFVVNLDAYLNAAKSNPIPDFQLQPDDVVFVPERSI
jgi:polysaccharide export outer membrane protein